MPAAGRTITALAAAALAAALAGCTYPTGQYGGREAIAALQGDGPPTSSEMARGQCWMRYENHPVAKNIDKKLELVEKCIEEKRRQYPHIVR
jgi:hypothetical protein